MPSKITETATRGHRRASLHWWEKTVEYAFVRQLLPKAALAIPLDGNPETALGDFLMSESATFRLIEFKARQDSIQSEKRKFPELRKDEYKGLSFHLSLLEGHDALVEHAGAAAHWVVFGEQVGERFFLKAQKYCAEGAILLDHGEFSGPTVSREVMVDYMLELAAARQREDAVSGSGGMVYCAIADDSVVSLPAEEFLAIVCPELQLSQEATDSKLADPGPTRPRGPSGP